MKKISVPLKASPYDVLIEHGLLNKIGAQIVKVAKAPLIVVVTSKRIRRLWGAQLAESMRKAKLRFVIAEINDGEQHKTAQTVDKLLQQFAKLGADRKSLVVAFGGGVVGDVAGFAASIYMRGILVVQVPTTLLAQVDAAIGGKTGVNLAAGKNLVGTFHQPRAVFIDPDVLKTLSDREFRAGLFEVIKCGVIRDASLFSYLENNREPILNREPAALQRIIAASVAVKAKVVAADECEGDLRRILNFGHTVGHALEAAADYKRFLHGEAVAWGMVAAAEIGVNAGVTPSEVAERIIANVISYGPLPPVRSQVKPVFNLLRSDKKTLDGIPHFVLPTKIGATKIVSGIEAAIIKDAIRSLTER